METKENLRSEIREGIQQLLDMDGERRKEQKRRERERDSLVVFMPVLLDIISFYGVPIYSAIVL